MDRNRKRIVGAAAFLLLIGLGVAASELSAFSFQLSAQAKAQGLPPPLPTGLPSVTPCLMSFSDVHPADYFYVPVLYLACNNVVSGYSDGTFRPYNYTTRSQMVKITVLGFKIAITTPAGGAYSFTDVPRSNNFFALIEAAHSQNIVSGYTCGGPNEPCDSLNRPYFRPYADVTRGQLSKIAVIAAGWAQIAPPIPTFSDVPVGSPFYSVIETALCHGVISGYNDGTFRPANDATRGQIAKIVFLAVTAGRACAIPTPPAIATATPTAVAGGPCPIYPADNIWNRNIAALPTYTLSAAYVASIGISAPVHPDFGSGLYNGGPIGIPFTTVTAGQAFVPIHFTAYGSESDPGPYPIPTDAPIEGGPNSSGDRHVLVVDQGNCTLYEMYRSFPNSDGSWNADAGALWNLNSDALRPAGWTSADAAGLAVLPGLVRYDEVASGVIRHALRFTAPQTQQAYLWPARHEAGSSTDPTLPPMGLRLRLKANVDLTGFPAEDKVILQALKDYGMFLADNGSPWFISGAPDERWDNDTIQQLVNINGSDFEAVDESGLMIDPNSGRSR
ncbi:MAG: S-layer homology domain-containing protein [Chloroflexia bacterium]